MIDHTANPETAEHFDLELAARVRNLPPYLFGKINELKYRKRRDGIDVIDLGMGNPTDPPEQWVIDKLCEAARDARNHRYSVASGVYNLRREVAARYEKGRDLVQIGAYVAGSDPSMDRAIELHSSMTGFLQQGMNEGAALPEALAALQALFGPVP